MPKIKYREKRISRDRMDIIMVANKILKNYADQGFDLTLRQLYYQMVAHDLFPDDRRWRWTGSKWVRDLDGTKNATPNYHWFGDIIDDGRMCGYIDWDMIEDRTRNLQRLSHWKDAAGMVNSAFENYKIDRWANQDVRLECWCEKEALIGIFARICRTYDIPYFACRGYVSQSEMWRAAQRFIGYVKKDKKVPVILHFGDHDPSGIDMTRDIIDRLELFLGTSVPVKRLALNMDQVEEHKPPPNPAKSTDARFKTYVREYGDESWELDALSPDVLTGLVKEAVDVYRDIDKWRETVEREQDHRARLKTLSDSWDDVSKYLDENHDDELSENLNELANDDDYLEELASKED